MAVETEGESEIDSLRKIADAARILVNNNFTFIQGYVSHGQISYQDIFTIRDALAEYDRKYQK